MNSNLTELPTEATAAYNKASELTSSTLGGTTTNYIFNADGQRLSETQGSSTIASATWNGAGELTSYDASAGDMTAATYDGDGLRTSATIGSSTQAFTWDTTSMIPDLLRLRIDDSPIGGGRSVLVVTVLVDEKEVFGQLGDARFEGWHPAAMLEPGRAPLLPVCPPRRVGLYTEHDVGSGCVTALVEDRGDLIAWADLRLFDGYEQPIMDTEPCPLRYTTLVGMPDLVFDAAQYRQEVARATADRWWETPELMTVRLLEERLRAQDRYLAELGWKLHFVNGGGEDGYWVVLLDGGDGQIIVELTDQLGSPEDGAAAMAATLLESPPWRWPVVECNICDYRIMDGDDKQEDDRLKAKHPVHGRKPPGRAQ